MVSSLDEDGNIDKKLCKDIIKRGDIVSVSNNIVPSYYVNSNQADLHRVLLCSALKTTLPKIQTKIRKNEIDKELLEYFKKDDKCIQKTKVSKELQEIYESCEEYDLSLIHI